MPNAPRRPDGEIHQEWAEDTSVNGKPSGDIALEVVFDGDNPDGDWTTHIYKLAYPDRRLNRGDKTAIVIEGLDETRERALTALLREPLKNIFSATLCKFWLQIAHRSSTYQI